jgi:hypothetical protein
LLAFLLAVLAAGLIVAGVAFIYWPLALIVAGVLIGAVAWFVDLDPKDAHESP